MLETIIENFADQGFVNIYLCLNWAGEMIREHFGDGRRLGVHITYLHEDRRLGTAGALSLLPERPTEPVIVMNGDLLTKVDACACSTFTAARALSRRWRCASTSNRCPTVC